MKGNLKYVVLGLFWLINLNLVKSQSISDSIDVKKYDIHLDISDVNSGSIVGFTQVVIQPKMLNLNSFGLYLLKMNIDSVFLNNQLNTNFSYDDTIIRFHLAFTPTLSDTFYLKVYYHGNPHVDPSGWGGFYFQSNTAFNLGVGFHDDPHCYGRVWFPCVDEFTEKAYFDTYITTSSDQMAVCGGDLLDVIILPNSKKTWHWKLHQEIPSYLASVAVSNYVEVADVFNGINGPIPIKIYVNSNDTSKVANSFVNLKAILQIFENRFGPYKWDRVGYVSVPFNSGAMEHACNISYPAFAITGDLSYESLYAHELSHHWFGDLITCETAQDMWINEGWASYCESVFIEGLYGTAAYKANVKDNHKLVLEKAHIDDVGYRAIYGIPSEYTYGTTVYHKGADVIHNLRSYMGDSLFFFSVKHLLDSFSFKNIGTQQFRNVMAANSGMNLNGFFDAWVYAPGFPQFSVDSFASYPNGSNSDYIVYIKQKKMHTPNFANSNKVEVTFMNSQWQQYSGIIDFSGEYASKVFQLPFIPSIVMMDYHDKLNDAITDYDLKINTLGTYTFTNTYFSMIVSNIVDSAFLRVEHNWVAPDPLKQPNANIKRIHDRRYWKVDGIIPQGFVAKGRFNFNKSSDVQELGLLTTSTSIDSLLMLYRRNSADDWHQIAFSKVGSSIGLIMVDSIKTGEYTFGIGMPEHASINELKRADQDNLQISPNPSNSKFKIQYNSLSKGKMQIIDNSGRIIKAFEIQKGDNLFIWQPTSDTNTTYNVIVKDDRFNIISTKKALFLK